MTVIMSLPSPQCRGEMVCFGQANEQFISCQFNEQFSFTEIELLEDGLNSFH